VEAAKAIRLVAVFVIGVVLAMAGAMIYVVASQRRDERASGRAAVEQRPKFVNNKPASATPIRPVQAPDVSESTTQPPIPAPENSSEAHVQVPDRNPPQAERSRTIATKPPPQQQRTRQSAAISQPVQNQTQGDGGAETGSSTEASLTQPRVDQPNQIAVATNPNPPPRAAPPPSPPRSLTLWSGTPISVRLSDPLSTDQAKKGQHFHASLASPIIQDGIVLAEAGSTVTGEVVEAKRAGVFHGPPELRLALVQIHTTDNQDVRIATTSWDERARSHNPLATTIRKTVDAVSDVLAVPMMRGHNLVVPANTILEFRLAAPLSLTEHTQ
jgi:type IV secretory pathway VirB10-like protein